MRAVYTVVVIAPWRRPIGSALGTAVRAGRSNAVPLGGPKMLQETMSELTLVTDTSNVGEPMNARCVPPHGAAPGSVSCGTWRKPPRETGPLVSVVFTRETMLAGNWSSAPVAAWADTTYDSPPSPLSRDGIP